MEIDAFHVQLKIVKNVNLKEIQAYVRSAINFILWMMQHNAFCNSQVNIMEIQYLRLAKNVVRIVKNIPKEEVVQNVWSNLNIKSEILLYV